MKALRDYQSAAVASVIPYWESKGNAPLLVVPTGGGKSLIQAALIEQFRGIDPLVRCLCLAHRKELIEQNHAEFKELCPDISTGIFSASLGRKELRGQVVFGQIQSIAKQLYRFDPFNIIFIDECHLVPHNNDGLYRQALNMASLQNPDVKIIGLSATPYRLGAGWLHKGEGAIFDGIGYDISIKTLLAQGHLVRVVSKSGAATPDLSKLHHRGGEFIAGEMERAYNIPEVTIKACDEIIRYGQDRRAWLIFSAGVDHAESIRQYMLEQSIDCEMITGETPSHERQNIVSRFKNGDLKCIVNCDVLTTGFNAPICDLIAILRATESTSLYVQIVGRGMRNYPDKTNCLLLDYGGNVLRHGLVDDVRIKGPNQGDGEPPAKVCPVCFSNIHPSIMLCPDCGHEFPPNPVSHDETAYDGALLLAQVEPEPEITSKVKYTFMKRHVKKNRSDSVEITYVLGNLKHIKEWVCLDHANYARIKALNFCHALGIDAKTTDELLDSTLPKIEEITYKKNGKFHEILSRKIGIRTRAESIGTHGAAQFCFEFPQAVPESSDFRNPQWWTA